MVEPPDEPPPGLRERKKQATRRALAEHALALFAEHGFDAVTVDAIAHAAGVSPRTVFRYVETKDDLLFTDDEEIAAVVGAAVLTRAPGDPLADVRAAATAFAGWASPRREALVARDRVIRATPALRARELSKRDAIQDTLACVLAERMDLDADRDVRPRAWATLGLGCLDAAYRLWLDRGGDLQAHVGAAFTAVRA